MFSEHRSSYRWAVGGNAGFAAPGAIFSASVMPEVVAARLHAIHQIQATIAGDADPRMAVVLGERRRVRVLDFYTVGAVEEPVNLEED